MENFNIAGALKYAPKGLKLYSPLIGEVEFNQIEQDIYYINYIRVKMSDEYYSFTKHGHYIPKRGECLLFPAASHRTWDNWQNILLPQSIGSVCVNTGTPEPTMFICTPSGTVFSDNSGSTWDSLIDIGGNYLNTSRYATPEESKQFFDELKANGYKFDGKDVVKITSTFKEGDWVVDKLGKVWHIDSVGKINYKVSNSKGYQSYFPGYNLYFGSYQLYNTNELHLWTIQDAKNGDVLVNKNGCPLIFKDMETCWCYYSSSLKAFQPANNKWFFSHNDYLCPATKEQRELLFQKMKEAGYEWNDDKKELKKIEQSYNNEVDEQELVEWSEDDNKKIEAISSIIFDYAFYKDALDENNDLTGEYVELDNWLATLPERFNFERFNFLPKQKLSERDKKLLIDTYIMLDWYKGNNCPKSQYIKDLLNSNKQQNNWKPSALQIEALESATENCAYSEYQDCLRDLIKQLKNLK